MALIGGGGAGNVAGGNPSGTGTSLNYIGDHCYAYSGSITPSSAGSAATTALLFTTANNYVMSTINWTCKSTSATVDQYFEIILNGEVIFDAQAEDDESATAQSPIELLLPPYTKVEIKVGDPATNPFTVVLVGRVYG